MSAPHLQLFINDIGQLLLIDLQEGDGLLQRLKHGVCHVLSFLNGQQVTHDLYQPAIVALLHVLAQASRSRADEALEI